MIRPPPSSPLFPSTTLFRSSRSTSSRRKRIHRSTRSRAFSSPLRTTSDRKSTRLNSSHSSISYPFFFFNDPAPPEFSPLPLHDALPIFTFDFITPEADSSKYTFTGLQFTAPHDFRSEEHTSELQSQFHLISLLFF